MKGLNLYLSMMRRRWLGNSLIALLIAVTSVFMLLYPGLIADSEEELEAAYKSIEVLMPADMMILRSRWIFMMR